MEKYVRFPKAATAESLYEELKAKLKTITMNEGARTECIFVNEEDTDTYPIANLSRADFEFRGYDTQGIASSDIRYIASKMGDSYVENQYWIDVDYYAEAFNMPKKS